MAATVGTGVYAAMGASKVNLSVSDPTMLALIALVLAQSSVRRRGLCITQMTKWLSILWYAWCTAIALSSIVPAVLGYADIRILGMAIVKAAVNAGYALSIPLALSSPVVRREGIVDMLRVWVIVAATQVFLAWVPAARGIVYMENRFQGLFRDPNLYAVFAAQSAALSLGFMLRPSWLDRIVGMCCGVACAIGIVSSGSRTGVAAFVATLVVATVMIPRFRKVIAVASVGLGLVVWGWLPRFVDVQGMLQRIGRASFSSGLSARGDTWESVFMAIRYSPFWGVGRDHFVAWKLSVGLISRTIPHNTYLGVIAETGVFGALLFLLIFVGVPGLAVFSALRRRLFRDDAMLAAVALTLPAFWAGGLGLNIENYRAGWLLTGVLIALVYSGRASVSGRSDVSNNGADGVTGSE